MSKKILSLVLALSLIMTCFSGITMIATAEASDLPEVYAYAYFDETGAVVASEGASIKYYNNSYTNPPFCTEGTLIPGTNMYGYTHGTTNYGLIFAGENLKNVAANKPVVYAIEYYIPGDAELTGAEILQMEDRVHGMRAIQGLPKGRGVVYYTLTAEDVEGRRNNDNWMMVRLRDGARNKLYITGFKVLDAAAAGVPTDPNAYFCGTKTDYYPNTPIVVTSVNPENNTQLTLQPRFGVDHVYLITRAELMSADQTTNKPIYLKVYAKDGVEDGTEINISSFEASDGTSRGHSKVKLGLETNPSFIVENGVAGLYLPETSFGGNTLKEGSVALGSLRFSHAAYANIARIEAYDVETYCKKEGSDPAMIEEIHAAMLANNHNLTDGTICATCGKSTVCTHENTTLTGAKDATCEELGYTGDVICDDCGATVTKGSETPLADCIPGERVNVKEATAEEGGYTGDVYCTVCGELLEKGIETAPTGHTEGERQNVKEPTCTEPGYTGDVYCTDPGCGKLLIKGESIDALGHTSGAIANAKQPTCTEPGYTGDVMCSVCGAVATPGTATDALGHKGQLEGVKQATYTEEGYTGDLVCTVCKTLLEKGEVIPVKDRDELLEPYAYSDWSGEEGASVRSNGQCIRRIDSGAEGNDGTYEVKFGMPIGDTGLYGYTGANNCGVYFGGKGLSTVPANTAVYYAIEYYVDSDVELQGGVIRIDDKLHGQSVFGSLPLKQKGVLLYPLTVEEVDERREKDNRVKVVVLGEGAEKVYITGFKVIDAQYVDLPMETEGAYYASDVSCAYYAADVPVTAYANMNSTIEEIDPEKPFDGYRYFSVYGNAASMDAASNKPVYVKIYTTKGNENTEITINAFEASNGTASGYNDKMGFAEDPVVQIVNGEGLVLLPNTCFRNTLSSKGSLRFLTADGKKIARIEVYEYTPEDRTELNAALAEAKELMKDKTGASVDAYMVYVNKAQAVADNLMATKEEIDAVIAELKEAASLLIACDHSAGTELVNVVEATCLTDGYSGDLACKECGYIAPENVGKATPAHGTTLINIKDPTCAEEGNTGDQWCEKCQKIAQAGNPIPKLPHTFDEGVVTKEPTAAEEGELTKTCTACGEKTVVKVAFVAKLGDVNGDNKIDSNDARLILQFAVRKIPPTALDLEVADVNGDEKYDSTDARLILQLAVGKIKEFPKA